MSKTVRQLATAALVTATVAVTPPAAQTAVAIAALTAYGAQAQSANSSED